MNPVSIPVVQVRPNMMLVYPYTIWPDGHRPKPKAKHIQLGQTFATQQEQYFEGEKAYSGQLKEHSRKRLQKAINLLVGIAEPKRISPPVVKKAFTFQVNFVTLTLPAAQRTVSDKDLKKHCLDPWLKSMRRKHQLRSYVWRAERQYNGNLHFHITTDTYLPQDEIRNEWNRFLSRFHFIDEFHSKHGYSTPNSTDVHAVWKIRNIASYMVKYMSKDPEQHLQEVNEKRIKKGKEPLKPEEHEFRMLEGQPKWDEPINGKVWDCSQNLKSRDRCECEADQEIRYLVNEVVAKYNLKVLNNEHCTMIFSNGMPFEQILGGELQQLYKEYIHRIRFNAFRPPTDQFKVESYLQPAIERPDPPPKSLHSNEVQTYLFTA